MDTSVLPASQSGRTIVERLGITPIINAGGPNTKHSGTRPRPECLAAMLAAADTFVQMDELLLAAGRAIAEAIGVEAATITSGASGGLVLQAAAALTAPGGQVDPALIRRLPETDGRPNALLIQRAQRFSYDRLYMVPGARLVEVGRPEGCTAAEIEAAITQRTAGIIDVQSAFKRRGAVPLPELAEIGRRHGLPVLCDAASMLPPRGNLTRFVREGADLVSFSGGKGIRGPQSTGLLLGRAEWVEAARLNNAPNPTIARGQKVSKEEIAGLLAAVEVFLAEDEAAETARYRAAMAELAEGLRGIPGIAVTVEHDLDDHPYPQAEIAFTREWRGPGAPEVQRRLMAGRPRVYVSTLNPAGTITIDPMNLQPGQLEIVIARLREELTAAATS